MLCCAVPFPSLSLMSGCCRSIEFRLRLPGVDLWTTHKPLAAEVCLMFMLLGAGAGISARHAPKCGCLAPLLLLLPPPPATLLSSASGWFSDQVVS